MHTIFLSNFRNWISLRFSLLFVLSKPTMKKVILLLAVLSFATAYVCSDYPYTTCSSAVNNGYSVIVSGSTWYLCKSDYTSAAFTTTQLSGCYCTTSPCISTSTVAATPLIAVCAWNSSTYFTEVVNCVLPGTSNSCNIRNLYRISHWWHLYDSYVNSNGYYIYISHVASPPSFCNATVSAINPLYPPPTRTECNSICGTTGGGNYQLNCTSLTFN